MIQNPKPPMPKARASGAEWKAYERAHAEWFLREHGALYRYTGEGTDAIVYTSVDEYLNDVDPIEDDDTEARPTKSREPADPVAKARLNEAIAYVREYTGTWAFILDLRSDRSFGSKYFTLTPRQVEVVLASKEREAKWAQEAQEKANDPRQQEALAYVQAYTGTFDFLLDLKARGASTLSEKQVDAVLRCKARDNAGERPAQKVSHGETTITQDGFYKHGEDIVKVQVAVHGSGNLYAKRLIVIEHGKATWEYAPGLVTQLTEAERLTFEQAVEFGRLYGVCGVCGRTLTDETSIEDGIGPICSGRLGKGI